MSVLKCSISFSNVVISSARFLVKSSWSSKRPTLVSFRDDPDFFFLAFGTGIVGQSVLSELIEIFDDLFGRLGHFIHGCDLPVDKRVKSSLLLFDLQFGSPLLRQFFEFFKSIGNRRVVDLSISVRDTSGSVRTHVDILGIVVEGRGKSNDVGEYVVLEVHSVFTYIAIDLQDTSDIGLELKCR